MKKTKAWIIGAALAVGFLFVLLPPESTGKLKSVGSALFLPFFKAKASIDQSVENIPIQTLSKGALKSRVLELEKKLAEAEIQIQEMEEIQRQLNNISRFIDFPEYNRWDMTAGRVVFRDPANWWRTVSIDLGEKEGIKKGMPVVTSRGLVGKIIEVHKGFSKVQLIGDDKSSVGAMLESGEAGIIRINHSNRVNPTIVEMDFLPSYSTPQQGDWVVTSGLSGYIPKGIRIGQVIDSNTIDHGLYKQARVKLTVNLSALEQVWVIKL